MDLLALSKREKSIVEYSFKTTGVASVHFKTLETKSIFAQTKFLKQTMVSIKHNIKVNEQDVFGFSKTCLLLQIFTVLKHANTL